MNSFAIAVRPGAIFSILALTSSNVIDSCAGVLAFSDFFKGFGNCGYPACFMNSFAIAVRPDAIFSILAFASSNVIDSCVGGGISSIVRGVSSITGVGDGLGVGISWTSGISCS